ncbi:hypothetical protein FJZ31_32465 [Candidatus Poribacteria bacterium]|nr:hypothetical protein [Candidatus Poribacteria bacterium]
MTIIDQHSYRAYKYFTLEKDEEELTLREMHSFINGFPSRWEDFSAYNDFFHNRACVEPDREPSEVDKYLMVFGKKLKERLKNRLGYTKEANDVEDIEDIDLTIVEMISSEVANGNLPEWWTCSNLRKNRRITKHFAKKYINTGPANRSISMDGSEKGNSVKGGSVPVFYRRGRRPMEYRVINF